MTKIEKQQKNSIKGGKEKVRTQSSDRNSHTEGGRGFSIDGGEPPQSTILKERR